MSDSQNYSLDPWQPGDNERWDYHVKLSKSHWLWGEAAKKPWFGISLPTLFVHERVTNLTPEQLLHRASEPLEGLNCTTLEQSQRYMDLLSLQACLYCERLLKTRHTWLCNFMSRISSFCAVHYTQTHSQQAFVYGLVEIEPANFKMAELCHVVRQIWISSERNS